MTRVETRIGDVEELARSQAERPASAVARFGDDEPLPLDAGVSLSPFQVAYKTYGELNADKSNAVLVCHALTGDQHVASPNPVTGKPGWWSLMVGPGLPIDTDRYFVICANVLGGCMGTTGPASLNPESGKPYGLDLPVITVRDMVRAQAMLIDRLGIDSLLSVLGGSMAGMQVLQWAASFPDRVFSAVPIACAARHSSQNIAFHEVGRQAVMADPDWCGGKYAELGKSPRKGLAVARMAAHITYLSEEALHKKFGRESAGPLAARLRLRRGLPGGILPAAPGPDLRRPLRRQLLSLHDPRHGLFRPCVGLWRRARQRLPRDEDALLRRLLHQRLAVPDLGEPRPSCMR